MATQAKSASKSKGKTATKSAKTSATTKKSVSGKAKMTSASAKSAKPSVKAKVKSSKATAPVKMKAVMPKASPAAGAKATAKKGGRGQANSVFMKPMQIGEPLAKIVGSEPLPRTEVTKRVWDYIKEHKLQDATNRRQINADDNLRALFGQESVTMFEMTKLINQHLS
jgi:upstream activation factor subunit UAF30